MSSSEKLCLQWNDFQENLNSAFKELRNDTELSDVTLVCEDGELEAHRVILSACSSFFHRVRLCGSRSFLKEFISGVQEVWAATANDIYAGGEYLSYILPQSQEAKTKIYQDNVQRWR